MAIAEGSTRIGIDVGGTFTDMFLWSPDGTTETFKVLSTPADPAVGVLDGLRTIADAKGLTIDAFAKTIATIVHGTTVTTNATLTRRGAKSGLLTTAGVRDALEMRRGIREEQYNNRYENVLPLVPRYRRRPIRGRLDWRGQELEALNLDDVRAAATILRDDGVEAVAICFMNSFANAAHEQAAAEVVRQEFPEAYLSVSTEVLPTIRFYNRVSTAVLNAYSGPVLRRYLSSLTGRLAELGFEGTLLIMQSSGGVARPQAIDLKPATTLLSGPAAGPSAALTSVVPFGHQSCLLVDMGGTSFDASLVRDGEVALKSEGDIDRLRIALPMLDIVTIGAGGGSIGSIDAGGLLRMGPESAGALPGPACYGRGGDHPTCTDADLVLGYLDAKYFAGGKLPLSIDKAAKAIETHVARPMGLSVDEAAAGMYRVVNANMAHGVREITVKRGLDPREFPMVVAGGAGALHACMIAHELDIPIVVVPPTASTLCATGMLLTDLQHDFVRSCVGPFDRIADADLRGIVAEMQSEGRTQLLAEGRPEDRIDHALAFDLRYLKQYHEVTVVVSMASLEGGDRTTIAKSFHDEHDRLYGYQLEQEGTGLELINVRVQSIGRVDKPPLPKIEKGGADPAAAKKGTRRAFVPEENAFREVPVYDGHALLAGNLVPGPALIERRDTTVFVSQSFDASVDEHGIAVLRRRAIAEQEASPLGQTAAVPGPGATEEKA